MWKCQKCNESLEDQFDTCWSCGTLKDGKAAESFEKVEDNDNETVVASDIILSTTPSLSTHKTEKYIGIVCSEIAVCTDVVTDLLADVKNIMGGTSEDYRVYLEDSRREVISDIVRKAKNAGANAIVGIKIGYESIGHGMIMVNALGTAVIVSKL